MCSRHSINMWYMKEWKHPPTATCPDFSMGGCLSWIISQGNSLTNLSNKFNKHFSRSMCARVRRCSWHWYIKMSNTQSLTPWGNSVLCEKRTIKYNGKMSPHTGNDVGTQVKEQELCRVRRERWGGRIHKNTISALSSPTHILTLTLRWYLQIGSMTKSYHCKSHLYRSTMGQSLSLRHTKSTTTTTCS